jgi:hypothetical protein
MMWPATAENSMIQGAPSVTHSNPSRRTLLHSCVVGVLALPFITGGSPARADTVVGNGKAASEAHATGEINAIALQGGLTLEMRHGSPALVVGHGDSNLLPLLESVVDNGQTLQLRWKRGTSVRTDSRI